MTSERFDNGRGYGRAGCHVFGGGGGGVIMVIYGILGVVISRYNAA